MNWPNAITAKIASFRPLERFSMPIAEPLTDYMTAII